MTRIQLAYVQRIRDRRGRWRYYFRRQGFKRQPLPGLPGSAEFMDAYRFALNQRNEIGASRTRPGSISALIVAYYASADFKSLKPITQGNYASILDRFREEFGDLPVVSLQPKHLRAIMDKRAATPGAAHNLLKRLRTLLKFAVERDWRQDNPAINVKAPRRKSTGFRAWEDADIAKFEGKWPAGTRAHLALMLLLYTGQRRSDVVRMGWQHVRDGLIDVVQVKGELSREPTRIAIPIHPVLQSALDATPRTNLTFLVTEAGKPFSPAGFSNWFVERAKMAGLPEHSSPHGLRKAASRRLAEAGATPHEIAAITGHRTLKEVERYTASVNQEHLARKAMKVLKSTS